MGEFVSVADAKAHLSELVSRVGSQRDRVTVTVRGRPTAVLLAVDDLEAIEETISVLSDASAVTVMAAADFELARGKGESEDALHDVMRARRASG
jgi:antitoxin YefM